MMDLRGAIKVCSMYLWTQNALIIHSGRKKESVAAASQGFNHLVQHDLLTGNPSPKGNNFAFQRAFSLSTAQIGGVNIYIRVLSQMDKMSR